MGCCKSKPENEESNFAKKTIPTDPPPPRHRSSLCNFVPVHSASLLEDYKIVKVIGEGGYGQVKLVVEKSTGLERACKSIPIKFLRKQELEAIFQEIKTLKSLDHPGIIKIFQVYKETSHIHIITELCTGGELFDLIVKHECLTENLAAKYMFDIVSTIKYLHEAGYMHRDLKPDNLIFDTELPTARLKIIDFGTATLVSGEQNFEQIVGTPFYIAPEVLKGVYGKQCDVWSIGVILYIMLCGVPPFMGKTNEEIYERILNNPPSFDTPAWTKVSASAKELIKKALNKNPKKRITISEFFYDPWIRTRALNMVPDKALSIKSVENLCRFKQVNKLQACTFVFLVQAFASSKELKHVRELFESFDKNGDGKLSMEEIRQGIQQYSGELQLNDAEVMANCDLDKNGFVDYSEFLAAVNMQNLQVSKEKLKVAFDVIDIDGDGRLTKSELMQALVGMTTEKNVGELLMEIDKNKDGNVDLDEFISAILNVGK